MSLFEKIEMERIEVEEQSFGFRSSRSWKDETILVTYAWWKRLFTLLCPIIFLPILQSFWEEGSFAFEVLVILSVVIGVWYLAGCVFTYEICLTPQSIIKRGYFGQMMLPADSLVVKVDEQQIVFYHGTKKNYRESIKIYRYYVATSDVEDIIGYAEDVYGITDGGKNSNSSVKSGLATQEFHKAVSSYKMMSAFFAIFACIAVFTVGINDTFIGIAPSAPAFAIRVGFIAIAIAGFLYLKLVVMKPVETSRTIPLEKRLKKEEDIAFACSAVAVIIAALGVALFLFAGNMLDFYLFLFVGILCFIDFYPRYSRWEKTVSGGADDSGNDEVVLPQRRSFHVSLVLMGALTVSSYGESYHYVYKSRQDCVNDWGDDSGSCQETSRGSGHWHGPRYGSGGGRPTRAVGVSSVSRGGFGSLGSFHASFGG